MKERNNKQYCSEKENYLKQHNEIDLWLTIEVETSPSRTIKDEVGEFDPRWKVPRKFKDSSGARNDQRKKIGIRRN